MRRRWAMWLAMAAAACGDDATGTDGGGTAMPATETGSGSGPGSDSGPGPGSESGPGSDSSGSASETGGSLDGTSEGSTAAATDDASGSSSDTGQPAACEGDGNCTIYPAPCLPDDCGTLDSAFDEDGCLRDACGIGVACPEGQVCYHAQWFGGCASSGVFCEDDPEQRACVCNSLPDCSGAYCVPEALFPTPDPGPDDGQVDDTCAPNDAPSTELSLGGLGTCPMDEIGVRLVFFSGPPEVGSYFFESQSDGFGEVATGGGVPVDAVAAWAEITALAGGVASGSYEVITEDAQYLAAEFTDVPVCAPGPLCG